MKSIEFKLSYIIYLVVCLLYSQTLVYEAISVRHIMTVIMFAMCLASGEVRLDRFLKWYLLYLFFYVISNIVTGHTAELIMKLAGTYLAAIVLYFSTKAMVLKYNASMWIVNTILVVAILDAIVTIGQFYGNPVALTVTDILRINNVTEESWDVYARLETLHGRTVGGLLGEVANGYFLSAACVLALYNKKNTIKIYNWALCVFLFFALLLVQERSGLAIGLISVVFYIIMSSRKKSEFLPYILIFVSVVFFMISYGNKFVTVEELRYSELGLDEGGRASLSKAGWEFVANYPLGGEIEYHSLGIRDPHNLLTNSFIFGGIFGGVVITLLIFFQLFICLKVLCNSFIHRNQNNLLVLFSLLYIVYTLNSFFHNPSLPAGVAMFFVCWGGVVAVAEKDNRTIARR